jgi:cytochrome c553
MKMFAFNTLASLILFSAATMQAGASDVASLTPESIHIQRCSACHFIEGKPPSEAFPHIAGQYEQYLLKALKMFKEGKRESEAMELITSLHREQELVILAHYYAQQKPAGGPSKANPDQSLAARGQQIYTSERVYGIACSDCHGADAKGYVRGTPRTHVERAIPRLAGQQQPYLKAKLMKYTGADGGTPQPGMCGMRKAGKTLNQHDVDALVEYISSK